MVSVEKEMYGDQSRGQKTAWKTKRTWLESVEADMGVT